MQSWAEEREREEAKGHVVWWAADMACSLHCDVSCVAVLWCLCAREEYGEWQVASPVHISRHSNFTNAAVKFAAVKIIHPAYACNQQ